MDTLIFHNDRIIPLPEARLSPGQMGLLMGWGVFTTLRVYEGKPFAFERHWARMSHDAQRLGMTLGREQREVRQAVSRLAEANHRPEGVARVSFVKNRGGLWAQADDGPETDLLIFTRQLVQWPAVHRLKLQQHAIYSEGGWPAPRCCPGSRTRPFLNKLTRRDLTTCCWLTKVASLRNVRRRIFS